MRLTARNRLRTIRPLAAVHFVRFALPPAARREFAGAEVALTIDHPNERARTVLGATTRRRPAEDLA